MRKTANGKGQLRKGKAEVTRKSSSLKKVGSGRLIEEEKQNNRDEAVREGAKGGNK